MGAFSFLFNIKYKDIGFVTIYFKFPSLGISLHKVNQILQIQVLMELQINIEQMQDSHI